jgi:DNA-binding response OmpR family regulator
MTTTILTVDDSASVRKLVQSTLRFKSYDVMAAADGVEALEALQRDQFNLVVLDINMPRLDGLSLLKTIRERPEWDSMLVLMLTTEGQETDRDQALALGANDYMVKPFKPTQLLARVEELLR